MERTPAVKPVEVLGMAAMASVLAIVACSSQDSGDEGPAAPLEKLADIAVAKSNMRTIHTAMIEFCSNYASFPSDQTSEYIAKRSGVDPATLSGDSSNPYFRQLLAAGSLKDEAVFLAGRPDDGPAPDGLVLAPGKNDFAYVVRPRDRGGYYSVITGNASAPLVLCSVESDGKPCSGDALRFTPRFFEGKLPEGLVLTVDGSVKHIPVIPAKSRPASIFPKDKHGRDTAYKFTVLPPEGK